MNVRGEMDAVEETAPDTGIDLVTDAEDMGGEPPEDTLPETPADAIPETPDDGAPEDAPELIPDPVADPVDDTLPGSGLAGDPCSSVTDCGGIPSDLRFCMDYMWGFIPFAGGYCTSWCDTSSDCGAGAGCAVGQCFRRCTDDSECRTSEGYTCHVIPYVTTETYCLPSMG